MRQRLNIVVGWLQPPLFSGNDEKTRRAKLLNGILLVVIVVLAVITVGIWLGGHTAPWIGGLTAGSIGVLVGLRYIMIRGHIALAGYGLIFFVFIVVTLILYGLGTVRAPGISAYVLLVVMAGLLLDRQGIVVATGLAIVAVSALILAEVNGLLPAPDYTITVTQWITFTTLLIMASLFIYWARQSIEDALAQVHQELAERRQAEQALRQSEEKFRTVVENSLTGIYIINHTYQFIYANEELARISGYPPEELVGLDFRQLLTEESLAFVTERYERRQRGEPVLPRYEYSIWRKDGQVRLVENIVVSIKDASGQPISFGNLIDITERKQAEAEREKLIADLEAKNAELEQFAYTVSHDLKSPLVTISRLAGSLEQNALAGNLEQTKTDIGRITEAIERMQRLLDELLELSRVGRLMNPPQYVPFETVIQQALALTQGRLAGRGVQVQVAEDLPTVYGDHIRLVEVIQNLVDNAAKFMGEQPQPHIEIGWREQAGELIFFVKDNGLGIEPQHHQKIFGLFDQIDKDTEGTGLGLALVKRIVEVHGGRIWVESEGLGRGATFCFTLPVSGPDSACAFGGNEE